VSGRNEGMVALVTGASQGGSGTGLAVRLAAEGARVAISARSEEGLDRTRQLIAEVDGHPPLVVPCDLGDPDGGRDTLVARTREAFGPLDILVNEPASHTLKQVHEFTLDEIRHDFEVNLYSFWLLMAQAIPDMREKGRGWILNFTSFSGELPPGPPFAVKSKDGSGLYGATKAALNRLTVAAAGENEGVIAVNAITPQVGGGRALNSLHLDNSSIWEPTETMVEAAYALVTGDPAVLSGRIAYSLQLIVELDLPVHDFSGHTLMEGWQPADLVSRIKHDEEFHAGNDWPDVFDFHRVNTPYPDALDNAAAS
jgi:NAD(P)-dependent dehydrogenase (short-subunit alcohol dehydrogenase family)